MRSFACIIALRAGMSQLLCRVDCLGDLPSFVQTNATGIGREDVNAIKKSFQGNSQMKAIVLNKYGTPDTLRLQEMDKPVVTGDNDVLIRICAAGVNRSDCFILSGTPYIMRLATGMFRPKADGLGADLAGVVEAIGTNVTRFRPGDEVFGEVSRGTCFAEYICVSEGVLNLKPANLTFEQAAAVPMAALTALQALRDKGRLQSGQRVLVNGASGGVGTFAVQIAKSLGAEVTGVCSPRNVEMVRSLGAAHVIDYTREDFTRGRQRYDLMLDNVGNRSLLECRRVLAARATYISNGGSKGRWLGPVAHLLASLILSPFVSQKVISLLEKPNREDLHLLKGLIETGKIAPVIDRTYRLNEVSEALRYLKEGHARGKVVVTI
jgi:NADPH:quinone reductase-like Zn-dependent oxidoreductase